MFCLCQENISDNTLVIDYINWTAATLEESDLLQDAGKNDEDDEHQESEVEKEQHDLCEKVHLEDEERSKKQEDGWVDHLLVSSISENKVSHKNSSLVDGSSFSSTDS
jgi:hypothetical protein